MLTTRLFKCMCCGYECDVQIDPVKLNLLSVKIDEYHYATLMLCSECYISRSKITWANLILKNFFKSDYRFEIDDSQIINAEYTYISKK